MGHGGRGGAGAQGPADLIGAALFRTATAGSAVGLPVDFDDVLHLARRDCRGRSWRLCRQRLVVVTKPRRAYTAHELRNQAEQGFVRPYGIPLCITHIAGEGVNFGIAD
jgi:hypothetical protein